MELVKKLGLCTWSGLEDYPGSCSWQSTDPKRPAKFKYFFYHKKPNKITDLKTQQGLIDIEVWSFNKDDNFTHPNAVWFQRVVRFYPSSSSEWDSVFEVVSVLFSLNRGCTPKTHGPKSILTSQNHTTTQALLNVIITYFDLPTQRICNKIEQWLTLWLYYITLSSFRNLSINLLKRPLNYYQNSINRFAYQLQHFFIKTKTIEQKRNQ